MDPNNFLDQNKDEFKTEYQNIKEGEFKNEIGSPSMEQEGIDRYNSTKFIHEYAWKFDVAMIEKKKEEKLKKEKERYNSVNFSKRKSSISKPKQKAYQPKRKRNVLLKSKNVRQAHKELVYQRSIDLKK